MNVICFSRNRASHVPAASLRDHHHRFILVVALEGSGQAWIDPARFSLGEGQALLIFPFQYHNYFAIRPPSICWAFVTFEMEDAGDLETLRSSAPRNLGKFEFALLEEIFRGWQTEAPASLIQLHLAVLLARLPVLGSSPQRRLKTTGDRDFSLLSGVNRHVSERLDKRLPVSLKDMARALGHSESSLRVRFRKLMGSSLGKHLRDLRLMRACSLLHGTDLPVGEIAEMCGFESIYSFSRAFKSARRVSPLAYRKGSKADARAAGRIPIPQAAETGE